MWNDAVISFEKDDFSKGHALFTYIIDEMIGLKKRACQPGCLAARPAVSTPLAI